MIDFNRFPDVPCREGNLPGLVAIMAIPFTGLIDADCRFTVYSRSSKNGLFYISTFVLEVKLFLYNHDGLHQLAIASLSSYDTAPASVFKGLPLLLAMSPLFNVLPRLLQTRSSFSPNPDPAEFSAFLPCGPTDVVSRLEPEPALRQPSSSAPARSHELRSSPSV